MLHQSTIIGKIYIRGFLSKLLILIIYHSHPPDLFALIFKRKINLEHSEYAYVEQFNAFV